MFVIGFFMGSVIRMIFGLVLLAVLVGAGFVALVGTLAATGGPGPCTPGDGPITIDAANAASFQQKWDAMDATLGGGQPASATFSESELSSRADAYLEEHDVGFEDARVCVHSGSGEGSATFSMFGINAKVRVEGTVELDEGHPTAHIDSMEIGNIPRWLTAPVEGAVNRAIDSALDDIDLKHPYAPQLSRGEAVISGTP